MKRYFVTTLGIFACLVAFAVAQEDPPAPKNADGKDVQKKAPADDDKKADEKKGDENADATASPAEDPKVIIERLKENFEKSRANLEKTDPGAQTRELQK